MRRPRLPIISRKPAAFVIGVATVIVAAVLIVLLLSWWPTTAGDGEHTTPAVTASAPPASTAAARRATSLADLDPCTMLTADQAAEFGYTSYVRGDFGVNTCLYLPPGANPGTGVTALSITFASGLSSLEPRTIDLATAQRVADYQGVRIEAADAPRCTLALGITASESVQVGATQATREEACTQVTRVAEWIEPRLPVPTP